MNLFFFIIMACSILTLIIGLSETVKITDRLETWKDKKSLLQIVYFEE